MRKKILLLIFCVLILSSCKLFFGAGFSGQGKSPKDIPGNILWLMANKGTSMTDCITPFMQTTDGGPINCWYDQSGNGYNASASAPAYLHYNIIGGKPSITLPVMQILSGSLTNTYNEYSFFSVSLDYSTDANNRSIFSLVGAPDGHYVNSGVYFASGIPTSESNKKPVVFSSTYEFNGGNYNSQLKINGKTICAGCVTSSSLFTTNYVISNASSMNSYEGYLSEVIVYNRKLNDLEIQEIELYLSKKYSISLSD